jgi:hypothetical protein
MPQDSREAVAAQRWFAARRQSLHFIGEIG